MTSISELLNFWAKWSPEDSYLHPSDLRACPDLSEMVDAKRIPEPWFGIPSKARIFYLTKRPGNADPEGGRSSMWKAFCHRMINEEIDYPSYLKHASQGALEFFHRVHKGFESETIPHICNLRLVAYPKPYPDGSNKLVHPRNFLPSTSLMVDYVQKTLLPCAQRGEILLLVMSDVKAFGFGSYDTGWTGNIYVTTSARSISISSTSRVGREIREFLSSN